MKCSYPKLFGIHHLSQEKLLFIKGWKYILFTEILYPFSQSKVCCLWENILQGIVYNCPLPYWNVQFLLNYTLNHFHRKIKFMLLSIIFGITFFNIESTCAVDYIILLIMLTRFYYKDFIIIYVCILYMCTLPSALYSLLIIFVLNLSCNCFYRLYPANF